MNSWAKEYIYKTGKVFGGRAEAGQLQSAEPGSLCGHWTESRALYKNIAIMFPAWISAHTAGSADPSGQYFADDDIILCLSLLSLICGTKPTVFQTRKWHVETG